MNSNQPDKIQKKIYEMLENNNGILKLKPTWVARKDFRAGKNLGLEESQYHKGSRGEITERWIASETKALNKTGPPDEGLSYIFTNNNLTITLKDAVRFAGDLVMGKDYFKRHKSLKRLIKILDYSDRIVYHYHQMEKDADLVGRNSKEEAYYFPEDASLGPHPETFFGVHPYITQQKKYDIILKHLIEWNSDHILKHSRAYLQSEDDGFQLPAGIPHAPGSALTIELQEDSDVYGILQAKYRGKILPREVLFHDIRREDREKYGEKIILGQIDWEKSGDPFFYENRHTPPIPIKDSFQEGGKEYWIFYNTRKFSGKKLTVYPGKNYISKENGVFTVLVWKGKGEFNGIHIEAKNHNYDELIISHPVAVESVKIKNHGNEELQIFKFFGPDINIDVPKLQIYRG